MKISYLCVLWLVPILSAWTAEEPELPAKAIQDNLFLNEEAYNQESGVVQHIFTLQGSFDRCGGSTERRLDLTYTDEWPVFSQRHQFSYTVPYSFVSGTGNPSVSGVGDVLLNYRYQALMETERTPAVAPRFSLILPTGNANKGLGNDTLGCQFNLPVSKIITDRITLHGNAGLAFLPHVDGRNLLSYNLGASAIYAVTPRFNVLLEAVTLWNENSLGRGRTERTLEAVLAPGLRYAFNFSASQLVLGLAAPIGATRSAPDYGVFFYASFEHGLPKRR